jgi:hypothetical protein
MDPIVIILLVSFLFGTIGFFIGDSRGYAAVGGLLGSIFGPLGIIVITSMVLATPTYLCPYCGGGIKSRQVQRCRHCGSPLGMFGNDPS